MRRNRQYAKAQKIDLLQSLLYAGFLLGGTNKCFHYVIYWKFDYYL